MNVRTLEALENMISIATAPQVQGSIAVIHLVRAANGVEPLRKFLNSYRQHDAGIPHDLVMLFKGFPGDSVPAEFRQALDGLSYSEVFVADYGADIVSYFAAANACHHEYIMFLNSWSEILDSNWLAKYHAHAVCEHVGVVSATGSWESWWSFKIKNPPKAPSVEGRHWLRRMVNPAVLLVGGIKQWNQHIKGMIAVPAFPNPHIRTNAFMIRRQRFLDLRFNQAPSKRAAGLFENGRDSLTRQLARMDLDAIVVGRDGKGYPKESWYESCTYRARDQANLLISDNRTRDYRDADPELQRAQTALAWGDIGRFDTSRNASRDSRRAPVDLRSVRQYKLGTSR